MNGSSDAVALQKLNIYYGEFHAVVDVDLRFERQKITAIIGPSGCGKSTVLRSINRMNELMPGTRTEGEILFHGQNIYDQSVDPVELRRRIGMESRHYGGWGIYTDEGSSHVLIENNLVHSCQGSFDQHYGKDNIVKNNIFCLGSETQMRRLRPETHASFIFTNNIIYFREGTVWAGSIPEKGAIINQNIYFDPGRKVMDFGGRDFRAWQNEGQDRDSPIADPLLRNPEKGDFRLAKSSPAFKMGFVPFAYDTAGPRPPEKRNHLTPEIMVQDLATGNLPIG